MTQDLSLHCERLLRRHFPLAAPPRPNYNISEEDYEAAWRKLAFYRPPRSLADVNHRYSIVCAEYEASLRHDSEEYGTKVEALSKARDILIQSFPERPQNAEDHQSQGNSASETPSKALQNKLEGQQSLSIRFTL